MNLMRDAIRWRLYVILDPEALAPGVDPLWAVAQALEGGATAVQLRDKRSATNGVRQSVALGRALLPICHHYGAPLIINDRLDVALSVGADGVHLGPQDLAIEDARRIAPDLIIGGSAKSLRLACELEAQGADYLGCGAVYDASASKADASAPQGVGFIAQICQSVRIPVVGIGGIHEGNAADVIRAGAQGVAVIRAVLGDADPKAAAQRLSQRL